MSRSKGRASTASAPQAVSSSARTSIVVRLVVGLLARRREHVLVTEVHPVEVPDDDGRPSQIGGHLVERSPQLHEVRL
jgi:hypothetical protein